MLGMHRFALTGELEPNGSGLRHVARCSCGWTSEPGASPVMAEAAAEQHVTLQRTTRRWRLSSEPRG